MTEQSIIDQIKTLENILSNEYKVRDEAQKIVDDRQKDINSIKRRISDAKKGLRKLERDRKIKESYSHANKKWSHEKLNIDQETKRYMKNLIFGTRDIDISIIETRLYLEEWCKNGAINSDRRRTIYILNLRAKGKTFKEIGDDIGLGREWVRQIIDSTIKALKHPRTARRLIINGGIA